MKRNYDKLLKECDVYEDKHGHIIFSSDIQAVNDTSTDKAEAIANALRAGFMLGYKRAKAEIKKESMKSENT